MLLSTQPQKKPNLNVSAKYGTTAYGTYLVKDIVIMRLKHDRINFVIMMRLSYRTCSFKSQVIKIKSKKDHKPSGFLIFV